MIAGVRRRNPRVRAAGWLILAVGMVCCGTGVLLAEQTADGADGGWAAQTEHDRKDCRANHRCS
jgi:hypothetical protein